MEYETCYVYKAAKQTNGERPLKRRKLEQTGLQRSWSRRRELFDSLWKPQADRLNHALADLDNAVVSNVTKFLLADRPDQADGRVDAAILVTGPNLASQVQLTTQISQKVRRAPKNCLLLLSSSDAPNLKAVLKKINIASVSSSTLDDDDEVDDEDEQFPPSRSSTKLLNYDLKITQQAVEERGLSKVVVTFQDCEAFDGHLLSELIELFSCWKKRIPFVVLFGVATSIEILQAKLSKRAIRCLQCKRFDTAEETAAIEQLAKTAHGSEARLRIGPAVCRSIFERQQDYLQTPQSAINSLQHAYMTHFYGNALSLFLDSDLRPEDVPEDHFEALRSLPSFMLHTESLVKAQSSNGSRARELLQSNATLFNECRDHIQSGLETVDKIVAASMIFAGLCSILQTTEALTSSAAILSGLEGSLLASSKMREISLHLKKIDSSVMTRILKQVDNSVFTGPRDDLAILLKGRKDTDPPLRSHSDIQSSTRRTTVIAKKIELSKAKTNLSEEDANYSEILDRFIAELSTFFTDRLVDIKSLPFREVFLFDYKGPHRSAFLPRPRHAIERALSSPQDYLACQCCAPGSESEDNDASLSSSQPASAVLYQLYLESGTLINSADLRAAFAAIMSDSIPDEEQLTAVFQRSMAELAYLGLVKGTKRRQEHLLKQSWRGL